MNIFKNMYYFSRIPSGLFNKVLGSVFYLF